MDTNHPTRGPLGRTLLTRLLAAFFLGLFAPLALLAQDTSGVIEGRVLNVGNGRYLNNARVAIEGTNRETFTNEYGSYRFENVPAGTVRIVASYTGLDTETSPVTVEGGQTTTQNFDLTNRARYGDEKPIQLDTFVVQSNREYEGNSLALNEQRYSGNVKVVMSSDSFGDVNEGNPGEFLKYLPGVTVDYVAADVRTVSVRGFGANFTNVYWDGIRMTSSASGASNRIFEFEQVSINNTSRSEVVKLPTPDLAADSLGGSINFISKNAFERRGAQFNYRAYMNANSENLDLKKTPGPGVDKSWKIRPNLDFDYTLPINDRFGIVVTGLSSNQFVEQHRWQPTWNFQQGGGTYTPPGGSSTTVAAATPTNPYLQQWQLQDGPKETYRASIGIKADYKLTDTQVISAAIQDNYYHSFFGNRNLNFNVGTNGAPTPSSGTPLMWGQDFVQSATGRASVTQGSSFRDKLGNTAAGKLNYSFDNGDWKANVAGGYAESRTWYRALSRGHFSNIGTTLQGVSIVRADNIAFPNLNWVARDSSGNTLDPYTLANYRIGTARNDPIDGKATSRELKADLEREFDGAIPFSIKIGGDYRNEIRDNRRYQEDYTYLGADGVANTADDNAGAYLDTTYINQDPYWGYPPIQWINPYTLADMLTSNPSYFRLGTGTNATGVQAETFRINNSERISEKVTAGFIQFDAKLFKNKLRVIGGVRYEKTQDQGEGVLSTPDAVWQRNADGSYVDSDGNSANGIQRLRRTDIPAAGTLGELPYIRQERAYKADRTYDGFYPSLHLTYNITNNLLARLAYAKTVGRPDYSFIIPNTDINEDDSDPTTGTITIRNTALKPWTADNFDASLEYYMEKGGTISVGAFQKNIKDFWGTRAGTIDAALASELGLDTRYIGWGVSTTVNSGDAEISGAEFNLIQPLTFLPGWGRYFTIKSNGTLLHLAGQNTPDFRGFISKTGNFNIAFNKAPWVANITFNYRGRQKGGSTGFANPALQSGAQYGAANSFFDYYAPRTFIDLSAEYKISKRFGLFASARNILNKEQLVQRYNAVSPAYSYGYRQEEFGVSYSVGVKGSF